MQIGMGNWLNKYQPATQQPKVAKWLGLPPGELDCLPDAGVCHCLQEVLLWGRLGSTKTPFPRARAPNLGGVGSLCCSLSRDDWAGGLNPRGRFGSDFQCFCLLNPGRLYLDPIFNVLAL